MVPMNEQEYDLLRARFGADSANWPEADARRAEAYLGSDAGQKHARADAALDALFAREHSVPGDADAFLARLMDIPAQEAACQSSEADGFLARLFKGVGGRVAFASQAAAYVIVLGVGIAIGMQGEAPAGDTDGEAVDLSAHFFASNAELYLEDE